MVEKKSCIIIGAAPCANLNFLDSELLMKSRVYAADGGYKTALRENIKVDVFIGDLDSNDMKPACADCTILPCEKDYTDVHTVVMRALDDGCNDFYLVGCSGGRADHYFANVYMLETIHNAGANAVLLDEHNEIRYLDAGCASFAKSKKYFSVLPLDEELYGVTLKGLKYSLDNATIKRGTSLGISNEWACDRAEIEIKKGRALLVFSEDDAI